MAVVWIDTVDGEEPFGQAMTAKEGGGNYGQALVNTTKVPAQMHIFVDGKTGETYNSGEYSSYSGLTIKLRGNTSASVSAQGPYNTKHPYKLKLQKKADLLTKAGLENRKKHTFQDKNWILLKDATSLKTFVGMAVADAAGTPWTPEFAFVNVVLNGDYRGIYLLTEYFNRSEARCNVAEDGFIIERDAYWYNEDLYIRTGLNQKYTFKYPYSDEMTLAQQSFIENYFKQVESAVQDGTYEDYIDTESFARWQLCHDILGTWDSAGSNIYMTKYDSTSPENPYEDGSWSKLVMSSPWDFDSNYWMEGKWANNHAGARLYENYLFKSQNKAFVNSYKSQWKSLSPVLWQELYGRLSTLQETLGDDINLARECECARWSSSFTSVEDDIATAEAWFSARVPWLDEQIGGM